MSTDTRQQLPPASILRNRNFWLLWAAYFISALGDHISEVALLELQHWNQRDDSTRMQSVILFTFMAPFVLFSPVAGWIADRLPRKWVMITADVIRASIFIFLLPVLTHFKEILEAAGYAYLPSAAEGATVVPVLSPWFYGIPLFILGIFATMFSPSRAALLPTLVRTDQIVRANALTNALGPIASIISFLLGSWLVTHYGVAANFHTDAATFLASAALLLFIAAPRQPRAMSGKGGSILEGFRYVGTHRRVRELIIFATIFWTVSSIVMSVIPALVSGDFNGDVGDIANCRAAIGIGIMAGAMLLSVLGDALKPELAIGWSLIGAGLCATWLFAVTMFEALSYYAGLAGLFGCGFFGAGITVASQALIQKIVPNRYRGRVLSVQDLFAIGGLLLATGLLSIPDWPHIDRYVPLLLSICAAMLIISGIMAVNLRLNRSRFGRTISFWYNLNYLYCKLMHRSKRIGICTIPIEGPVIVAANHVSSVDPLILLTGSPNRYISYMIAREYYEFPIAGRVIRLIDCVPVNRTGNDTASIKAALRHLADGRVLGIFPQGGIRDLNDDSSLREGIGMLALRSGATVIPAYVGGIDVTDSVYQALFSRHKAYVRFGKPVDMSAYAGREKDREAYGEASRAIMEAIRELSAMPVDESAR